MKVFYNLFLSIVSRLPISSEGILHRPAKYLLQSVIKYRQGVIDQNLLLVFPDKTSEERGQIKDDYYSTLLNYISESLKIYQSNKAADHFLELQNSETLRDSVRNGKKVILLASHLGNWEVTAMCLPALVSANVVGVYKPLQNQHLETIIKAKRSKHGLILITMKQVLRRMLGSKESEVFLLLSDQSPQLKTFGEPYDFFGIQTYFQNGASKLAMRFDCDVYYLEIGPKEGGKYKGKIIKPTTDNFIKGYCENLEKQIRKHPHLWLWSHKRWKLND